MNSCTRFSYTDLLFKPSGLSSEKNTLSIHEMKEDLEILVYALTRAYPGAWAMSSDAWKNIVDQIQNLSLQDATSPETFGTAIADILWDIPDGHLKVRLNTQTLGDQFHKNLREPSTGNNLAGEKVWSIEHHQSPKGLIPIIAISWFPQPSEIQWDGFLEEVSKLKHAPALIIDIRGNDGGNDSKAIDMTSILLGKELIVDWVREVICETAESYALQMNTYEKILWNTYGLHRDRAPREITEELENLKQKAKALKNQKLEKTFNQLPASTGPLLTPNGFQGPIFVLIDSKTKSSGEWTALYLQKHPNTVLVGDNTYGMIHFGNSGILPLPNSRLEITLCMKINELSDGRFVEKTGIPPDVLVSNDDSLEYTLKNLIK